MKKAVVSIVFLIICAAAVFFVGWVQFFVPAGSYGVLISKTGGLYPHPIESGVFAWRWERLLPTNSLLRIFNLSPATGTETVSGKLPAADLYAAALDNAADFTYRMEITVSARVSPSSLIPLIREKDFHDQAAFDAWLKTQTAAAAQAAAGKLLEKISGNPDKALFTLPAAEMNHIMKELNSSELFPYIEITDLILSDAVIPDMALYRLAEELYRRKMIPETPSPSAVSASADAAPAVQPAVSGQQPPEEIQEGQ